MADTITIRTNHVARDILRGYELTDAERAEFDYLDFDTDSGSFFRFKGHTYDLGEFDTTSRLPDFNPLRKWDGYHNDSFFSGVVVRYADDYERVVVGTFYA